MVDNFPLITLFGSLQTKVMILRDDKSTERKIHAPTVPHRA
jgi:hypothetical protein